MYMPNFRSIGPSKEKLQRGGAESAPLAIPICKKPGLFRVNRDLGNSLGDKSTREPNQRGLKLLELANYFNLCPIIQRTN